jgi:hypothetical protein
MPYDLIEPSTQSLVKFLGHTPVRQEAEEATVDP